MRDTLWREREKERDRRENITEQHNIGVEIITLQYSIEQWQYAVKSPCSAHRHENKMMLDLLLQGMCCCLNIQPIILCHRQQ